MECLYLHSARAADLGVMPVEAILACMYEGGHLIVGVEQPSDITGSPWLKSIFPCELQDLKTISNHPELQDWLRNTASAHNPLPPSRNQNQPGRGRTRPAVDVEVSNPFSNLPEDFDFEGKEMQIAIARVPEGNVEVSAGDAPLIVTTHHGQGRLTALLFSPEREPV